MATISLFLDQRNKNADTHPLVIRVSHRGKRKDLPTGYKLASKEWNDKKLRVKAPFENANKVNLRLKRKIALGLEVITQYASSLHKMDVYGLTVLIQKKHDETSEKKLPAGMTFKRTTLKEYGIKVAERYEMANRQGTAGNFRCVVRFLTKYKNDKLLLTDIDETFLEELEAYYLGKGLRINGLGAHLRPLRRIINLAIKDKETELTQAHYPFGINGYTIKSEKTKKRAIKLEMVHQIRELELDKDSSPWHHRNYFLFMFNMRGMNFIDLAFLKRENLVNDRIRYKRRKTRRGANVKEFDIRITEEARQILDYYLNREGNSTYVFPIMDDTLDIKDNNRLYMTYKNKLINHNRRLDTIGRMLNPPIKLTSYVVRHTFATAGLYKGVSKAQIGDMLGHTNYYTTEAYLDDFDKEVLDEAADKILG